MQHYCYTSGLGVTTLREKATFIRRQDKKGHREPAKHIKQNLLIITLILLHLLKDLLNLITLILFVV